MSTETQLAETLSGYRMNIRAAVRGLWTGRLDYEQFFANMMGAIRRGFTQAWYEGAKECGIAPNELKPEERLALEAAINSEMQYIDGLGAYVVANSKANKGKLGRCFTRTKAWINRYNSLKNQAKLSACGDRKLKWVLHGAHFTEDPCRSCRVLDGKVKRASYWQAQGVQPQNAPNDKLICQGFQCGCAFFVTDEPLSRGPLPRLP